MPNRLGGTAQSPRSYGVSKELCRPMNDHAVDSSDMLDLFEGIDDEPESDIVPSSFVLLRCLGRALKGELADRLEEPELE